MTDATRESIAAAVRAFGGEAVMTPAGLPSGTDRIAHYARSLAGDPVIVNIQGDEPFATGEARSSVALPVNNPG